MNGQLCFDILLYSVATFPFFMYCSKLFLQFVVFYFRITIYIFIVFLLLTYFTLYFKKHGLNNNERSVKLLFALFCFNFSQFHTFQNLDFTILVCTFYHCFCSFYHILYFLSWNRINNAFNILLYFISTFPFFVHSDLLILFMLNITYFAFLFQSYFAFSILL